jgi:hypothetical protein
MAGGSKFGVVVGITGDLLKYKMAKELLLELRMHEACKETKACTHDW